MLLLLLLLGLCLLHYRPSRPLPVDAPPDLFSAARAEPLLEELVGDGLPHPWGSRQHAVVRNRIVEILERFGYSARIQTAEVPSRRGERGIENIVARREGTDGGRAVMLVSHYDSVPAGPGAADDAASVAIMLEIARLLRRSSPLSNDIVFLFTDAEEIGLLGARGFVQDHPWAESAAVVINLDARGTSGPSLMFEASREDRWLVRLLARSLRRPFTSSLFIEIYRRMPNDTDFTIFLRAGKEGYNFAFIGGGWNYHTDRDTIENLDRGSLQHQGENALALTRALAGADLSRRRSGRAVYFDILGLGVVRWPRSLTVPLAVLALILVHLLYRSARRSPDRSPGRLRRRRGAALLLPVAVLLIAFLTSRLADWSLDRAGVFTATWIDHPLPPALLLWAAALLPVFLLGRILPGTGRLPDRGEILYGTWMLWAVLAVVTGIIAPGGSYLFLVPTLAAVLAGVSLASTRVIDRARFEAVLALLTLIVPALLWFETELIFYEGLGFGANPVLAVRAAVFATLLLPAFTPGESRSLPDARSGY